LACCRAYDQNLSRHLVPCACECAAPSAVVVSPVTFTFLVCNRHWVSATFVNGASRTCHDNSGDGGGERVAEPEPSSYVHLRVYRATLSTIAAVSKRVSACHRHSIEAKLYMQCGTRDGGWPRPEVPPNATRVCQRCLSLAGAVSEVPSSPILCLYVQRG
jgi:hypothetical protein